MYCTSCGAKNASDSNFCRQCGLKLDKASAPKISEEEFDRALPVDEQVAALLDRAYRRRKAGDVDGAVALCEEVLQIRPDSTTAHGLLGQLFEQSNRRDRAIEHYERVLQLNPASIADRVKLDELRDAAEGVAPRGAVPPRVVLVDSGAVKLTDLIPWAFGLVLVLVLVTVALTVVFGLGGLNRGRDVAAGNAAPLGAQNGKVRETTDAASVSQPAQNTSRAAEGAPANGSQGRVNVAGNAGNAGGAGSFPAGSGAYAVAGPLSAFPAPASGFAAPGTQFAPAQNRPAAAPQPAPPRGDAASPASRKTETRPAPDEDLQGSVRVRLSGSSAGDSPTIHISRPGDKAGPRAVATGDTGQTKDPVINVRTRPSNGSDSAPAVNTPSTDAATMIALGQEKLSKMDYAGAVTAFRRALAGANDDTAYVYQKLGESYQLSSQTKNALAMFERGRDEYKKMISGGRQVERATEGLRVCENGIKICGSE